MPVTTIDRHGQPVVTGDRVKILAISPDLEMDDDDLDMFNDMIGSTCEVERSRVGAGGGGPWWGNGLEGPLLTTAALTPGQMEKAAA